MRIIYSTVIVVIIIIVVMVITLQLRNTANFKSVVF